MPCNTWTPHAVAAEAREAALEMWRAVEAQHLISTMRLVDNRLDDQRLLEEILEESKPEPPPSSQGADYLLFTPFRYRPAYGSRFREPSEAGIFYGADEIRTACAELGFWRWRFLMESEGLRTLGLKGTAHTVFRSRAMDRTIDLRSPPFVADRAVWTDPVEYRATQALARSAREADVGVIRYESVRDPEHGGCAAVLRIEAFSPRHRLDQQTWYLSVSERGAVWQREGAAFDFPAAECAWPVPVATAPAN